MQLSFVETMRGEVTDDAGRVHAVDFEIRAEQCDAGRFRIEGVVHAGAFGDEARCDGTLTISALPPSIAYDVRWQTSAGELALRGAKSPTPFAPLRSMTRLPVELVDATRTVRASGTMSFDLRDLPQFLASWLPIPLQSQRTFSARLAAVTRRQLLGDAS